MTITQNKTESDRNLYIFNRHNVSVCKICVCVCVCYLFIDSIAYRSFWDYVKDTALPLTSYVPMSYLSFTCPGVKNCVS